MKCPCESTLAFANCCAPFLEGKASPPTAEALMRSRYTAYTKGNIDYIKNTLASESQKDFDINASKKWANDATWKGLKVLKTEDGLATDKKGTVEFVVTYALEGETLEHHEVSQFRKNNKGQWVFVDGQAHTHKEGEGHHDHQVQQTIVRESPKVGRNDPCPCGSGKKYKKCCGA